METVTVHWAEVVTLVSRRFFEVELSSGVIYFGALATGPSGQLTIVAVDGTTRQLALAESSGSRRSAAPSGGGWTGASIWDSASRRPNLETRWTLNSAATYRSPRYRLKWSLSSQLTVREDAERLSRHTLTLSANRLVGTHWFTFGMSQLQQNEELSLELRALGGGGLGRDLSQTNTRQLSGFTGIVATREHFTGEACRYLD